MSGLHKPTFVREKLTTIVKEHLVVEDSKIVDSADFIDDLGCDSLDVIELSMAVEEEFNIEVSDSETEKTLTFGDMVALVEEKTRGR